MSFEPLSVSYNPIRAVAVARLLMVKLWGCPFSRKLGKTPQYAESTRTFQAWPGVGSFKLPGKSSGVH
jgi:hypothetical protein